jgi:UDP-glucose-4-epimerase GalE
MNSVREYEAETCRTVIVAQGESEMAAPRLLALGGAGYVGSHFARFAAMTGARPVIFDNLSQGHLDAIEPFEFIRGDLSDGPSILRVLQENRYDGIFHFASSCLVGESVARPDLYYHNNVISAYNLLEAMRATGHDRLVFSSSCAVYGVPERVPIDEDSPKAPVSPYGRTKLTIEWMLEDYSRAYGLRNACLRYFNAAGCRPQEGLGEDHRPETHLIPNVVRYALGLAPELTIFGDDYPTVDGTCVRDYVHVWDLAEAHLAALHALDDEPCLRLNLGTGNGCSNLEVIAAVEKVLGRPLDVRFGPRRPGDPPELVANPGRAQRRLNWKPRRSGVHAIVRDVVEWFQAHPGGYAR